MASGYDKEEAVRLLEEANRRQLEGEIEEAIQLYQASIDNFPTADAHTYLGWMYSFQGRIEEAIQECQVAIELDPDFGNPYNDIGVYLMTQGRLREAFPWLEKAKAARRYGPRHFLLSEPGSNSSGQRPTYGCPGRIPAGPQDPA